MLENKYYIKINNISKLILYINKKLIYIYKYN